MKPSVLIIDDEQSMCDLLQTDLRLRDFAPCCVTSAQQALEAFSRQDFEVVLTDLKMPGIDGIQLCSRLVESRPDVPVVVMTAFGSLESAIAAMRAGAYDFVTKPIEMELLAMILSRAVERRRLQQQIHQLSETLRQSARFEELLGESAAMQKLYDQLSQVADSEATVLITGESGTGKELVAKALHQRCRRRAKPFVAVNCAALPDTLLESELFGHVKGAFTDARAERKGLFLQAEGGTLLLDEIGEMPLADAGQAVAGLGGKQGSAARRGARNRVRRAHSRGDESRFGDGRRRRPISAGPVFPRQCHPIGDSAASLPRNRYAAAGPALHRDFRAPGRRNGWSAFPKRSPTSCSPILGRATCASCETSSSGRSP